MNALPAPDRESLVIVAPAARGRGIPTQAVRLLSLWALAGLGLQRLQLSISPGNASSIRVAEKAGYRLEGTLRSAKVIRGERVDSSLYSLLPEDVAAGASRPSGHQLEKPRPRRR